MDTTDPDITFDRDGVCQYCHSYDMMISRWVPSGEAAKEQLDRIVATIKKHGKGKRYDCIVGVSGGVDSTYTAYKVVELGLRPLAVHLDNGWDSELAVKNIEHVLKKLNVDLYTHVIEWEEFKDLQLAFLKASTPDSEIPSDHAILSLLYRMAEKKHVRYIISGYNLRTESHLPLAWSQGHFDWRYIKSIHKMFGHCPLKTYPHRDLFTRYRQSFFLKPVDILNCCDFNKKAAMKVLEKELGWRYYGGKHYESIYTRFYQGYILPRKFGFDKRKTHLSSLICAGEITRQEALAELEHETYPAALQQEDKTYVVKKLGITAEEFESIMKAPTKTYWDYPNYAGMVHSRPYQKILNIFKRLLGRARS
jgi:N-acetyl sugar amidotransferase